LYFRKTYSVKKEFSMQKSLSSLICKILVVEDDEICQTVHRFMLERLGFEVEVVDKGQAAIDRTATEDYAAVLLDFHLPDINGDAVITAIRMREQTTGQHLPIMLNSALADEETRQMARDKGADLTLMKPVSKDNLQSCLEKLGLLPLKA
jgi:two-component system, sensor histidine kinase and response regulator